MWLPEIGAYYYKARVYFAHLGIFAQTDPVGYVDSPNLYAYVLDDPVNLTDPLGFTADLCDPTRGSCEPIPITGSREGGLRSNEMTSTDSLAMISELAAAMSNAISRYWPAEATTKVKAEAAKWLLFARDFSC